VIPELWYNYGQINKAVYTGPNDWYRKCCENLGTKILIALAHNKVSQIKNSNTTNILHKKYLLLIKHIHGKPIKNNL